MPPGVLQTSASPFASLLPLGDAMSSSVFSASSKLFTKGKRWLQYCAVGLYPGSGVGIETLEP